MSQGARTDVAPVAGGAVRPRGMTIRSGAHVCDVYESSLQCRQVSKPTAIAADVDPICRFR